MLQWLVDGPYAELTLQRLPQVAPCRKLNGNDRQFRLDLGVGPPLEFWSAAEPFPNPKFLKAHLGAGTGPHAGPAALPELSIRLGLR